MNGRDCRILADGHMMDNDTRATGLNNNDAVIGGSGSGKTRGYVKPNIMQCSGSMVITDTKGTLRQETGGMLEREGYHVMEINLADHAASSCGYSPFDYIRMDKDGNYIGQDIMKVAACIVPVESVHEPVWDLSARMYLECIIGYILECLPEREHTMESVALLFMEMPTGKFDTLMTELCSQDPGCFAAVRYRMFRSTATADRMYASIMGMLAEKLNVFISDGAKALASMPQRIRFGELGERKAALFLTVSDTDRSMDRLANLFYAQALQALCDSADQNPSHSLDVPVRMIMDDFASNVRIPNFPEIISIIRSRNISVSIILQSISQLEGLYGHADAMTILDNCDNCLYLGGQDVGTAKYMGIKANRSVHSILESPAGSAWLFTRGKKAEMVQTYDITGHERYGQLQEVPDTDGLVTGIRSLPFSAAQDTGDSQLPQESLPPASYDSDELPFPIGPQ